MAGADEKTFPKIPARIAPIVPPKKAILHGKPELYNGDVSTLYSYLYP